MSRIYITGHKNPDLDSVLSAYSYAVLKNLIDPENEYIPVRPGHLSDNTRAILNSLGIDIPVYKKDIYPTVGDVLLKSEEKIDISSPLNAIAINYKDSNPSVIPVYDNGSFYGLLSVDDITTWAMNELSEKGSIETIPTIKDIMREQELPVYAGDMFEDAKMRLAASKKRGLAVYNDKEEYVGYVTRRCFLQSPKHNVILVDHNEPKQSIRGIETANIVEIIDHHRLDAVKTELPIFIDAEPLGSTCTIVYQLFVRNGIRPDRLTAKTMLAGIIADTLILKSPTTTAIDEVSAHALAVIAGVNMEEFGLSMFSNMEGLKTRDPEKAITSDFKSYNERGVKFGIGQCEVMTLEDLSEYSANYLESLEHVRVANGLDWAVLMITDVMKEHSMLLCTNYRASINLQYVEVSKGIFDMPGVMSRKKQLLPEVIHAVSV